MNTRIGAVLAFVITAGVSTPAFAQSCDEDTIVGIPVHVLDASSGYSSRASGIPFDLWTNANASGLFRFLAQGTGKHVLEDINFAPGPWGTQASRVIDAIDF